MSSAYRENNPLDRARMGKQANVTWRRLEGGMSRFPWDTIFRGPVAMLVDAGTHSAAEDTAALFRLMRRGLTVGSATAGGTGQPWMFDIPGGGKARICVKRDEYIDGTTFVGTGIIPDVQVPLRLEDVRAGRDAALDRAVHELLAG
jgi:C-terminal processing protease CtpA/Prc